MIRSFLFFSVSTLPIFAGAPSSIDCGKFSARSVTDDRTWASGALGFNGASTEMSPFFQLLKEAYHIDIAIETGTFKGETAAAFARLFNEVHTIEILEKSYKDASTKLLSTFSNVHCHLGSSEKILEQILPKYKEKRILFYLDAHWQAYWPLLDELEQISKTHKDNCVIVIDDFKVPDRPDIPYDAFGDAEASFEYVKVKLGKIFTDYNSYILLPKNVRHAAKFVAFPKQWKEETNNKTSRTE